MYHVDVTWKEETVAICSDNRGNEMLCDWDSDNSLSPVQIMVQMVGVCSMAEIVVGMKEREFDSLSIGIDYERNNENPRYVKNMNLIFKLNTASFLFLQNSKLLLYHFISSSSPFIQDESISSTKSLRFMYDSTSGSFRPSSA